MIPLDFDSVVPCFWQYITNVKFKLYISILRELLQFSFFVSISNHLLKLLIL